MMLIRQISCHVLVLVSMRNGQFFGGKKAFLLLLLMLMTDLDMLLFISFFFIVQKLVHSLRSGRKIFNFFVFSDIFKQVVTH